MNLVLFGPPGAGKGTQAAVLCTELGVPQVATGDIFRRHLKEGTALGEKARAFMNNGQLVPDEVVWDLVAARLTEDDCEGGVLLDGFPRSLRQAELLVDWMKDNGRRLECVVALVVPDEVLVMRLARRRTCLSCGGTYHLDHAPTVVEGICDTCGGEVVQRTDDNEETVRARLETYHKTTSPVLTYFEGLGLARRVDGVGDILSVSQRISLAIG
jgi:adenylate kinase